MIRAIDTNLWVGSWPTRRVGATAKGLLAMMDRYGVDRGFVSHLHAIFYKDPSEPNRRLDRSVRRAGQRLVSVPIVDPTSPWASRPPERFLRLVPSYHRYTLRNRRLCKLLEAASEKGLDVFVSLRMRDERLESPLLKPLPTSASDLASTISRFPSITFVVNNARSSEIRLILSRTDNALVGCDWSLPIGFVEEVADEFGPERLVLGTNAPLHYYGCALLQVREADIPASWRRKILWENAQKLLRG